MNFGSWISHKVKRHSSNAICTENAAGAHMIALSAASAITPSKRMQIISPSLRSNQSESHPSWLQHRAKLGCPPSPESPCNSNNLVPSSTPYTGPDSAPLSSPTSVPLRSRSSALQVGNPYANASQVNRAKEMSLDMGRAQSWDIAGSATHPTKTQGFHDQEKTSAEVDRRDLSNQRLLVDEDNGEDRHRSGGRENPKAYKESLVSRPSVVRSALSASPVSHPLIARPHISDSDLRSPSATRSPLSALGLLDPSGARSDLSLPAGPSNSAAAENPPQLAGDDIPEHCVKSAWNEFEDTPNSGKPHAFTKPTLEIPGQEDPGAQITPRSQHLASNSTFPESLPKHCPLPSPGRLSSPGRSFIRQKSVGFSNVHHEPSHTSSNGRMTNPLSPAPLADPRTDSSSVCYEPTHTSSNGRTSNRMSPAPQAGSRNARRRFVSMITTREEDVDAIAAEATAIFNEVPTSNDSARITATGKLPRESLAATPPSSLAPGARVLGGVGRSRRASMPLQLSPEGTALMEEARALDYTYGVGQFGDSRALQNVNRVVANWAPDEATPKQDVYSEQQMNQLLDTFTRKPGNIHHPSPVSSQVDVGPSQATISPRIPIISGNAGSSAVQPKPSSFSVGARVLESRRFSSATTAVGPAPHTSGWDGHAERGAYGESPSTLAAPSGEGQGEKWGVEKDSADDSTYEEDKEEGAVKVVKGCKGERLAHVNEPDKLGAAKVKVKEHRSLANRFMKKFNIFSSRKVA
eukprot:gene14290-20267_t